MAQRPRPGEGRPLRGPLRVFDLDEQVARLRDEKEWREGRRNSITLNKSGGMSVVLIVMERGDRLEEHSASGPISLGVREGRVRFWTPDEEVEAGPDALISCDAGVRHSVEAVEDSVCVLTIARRVDGRQAGGT